MGPSMTLKTSMFLKDVLRSPSFLRKSFMYTNPSTMANVVLFFVGDGGLGCFGA